MLTKQDLAQFTGSETLWRHSDRLLITEGVKYLAKEAEAFWLLDAIAFYQPSIEPNSDLHYFQLWVLSNSGVEDANREFPLISPKSSFQAVLCCYSDTPESDMTDNLHIRQEIETTNFSLAEIKLYVCYAGITELSQKALIQRTLMLSSEY